MKLKKLAKKIRRLEARLQKGATKLANLKHKLRAIEAANLAKAKRNSARTRKGLTVGEVPAPTQTVHQRLTAMTAPKPEGISGGRLLKTVKKKRSITPERRAQLSAAMKARWAAKRAATPASPEPNSHEQTATPEESSPQ